MSKGRHTPGSSASKVNPGRRAAVRALVRVDRGERGDHALDAVAPPAGKDRGLAWHLLSGTLQHRAELDHVIAACSSRPLARLDPTVLAILRVALFELRYGRAPDRAVVHQAAELTRLEASKHVVGFVNAVLRNRQRAGEIPPRVALNHPEWLLARWEARYGAGPAASWALDNNQPPPLCVATAGDIADLDTLLAQAALHPEPALAAGVEVPGMRRILGPVGQVGTLPGAAEGLWWVQDAAAAAVADLVGCQPGWHVLDACAAPGGKTFRLVSQGARVLAVDRSAMRLELIQQGLVRLGMKATLQQHDWLEGSLESVDPLDAVLVDAPCSGLGTLRRHPEIRWRRKHEDLTRNAIQQYGILKCCSSLVRSGGVLVYAVCSAEPEEGEQVVGRFLEQHQDFVRDSVFCSAPPTSGEDAFWAARLLRG